MKNLIAITLIAVSISSCSLERRCRKCKGETKIEFRDSIVTKEIVKSIKGDTVTNFIRVECPDGQKPIVNLPRAKKSGKTTIQSTLINPNLIATTSSADSASIAIAYNERHTISKEVLKIPCKEKNNLWLGWLGVIAFVVGFILGRKK